MKLPSPQVPPNVVLEDQPCPLGCPRSDESVVVGGDRICHVPGRFTVVRCRTCSLMRTNPRPTLETIGVYYPNDYGPYVGTRIRPAEESATRLKQRVRQALDPRTEPLPDLPPGRLLEIGSASGTFLQRMHALGWQVRGIEPSAVAAGSAQQHGHDVHVGPVESAPPPSEALDLVVGWMVAEHLHRPLEVLQQLSGWVRPGGYLVLSVPNASAVEARLFRDKWYALQLPTHLYHYTPKTLERMLSMAGWRMERVLHQRTLGNLAASAGYALADRDLAPRLAQAAVRYPETGGRLAQVLHPLAAALAAAGQTGRMAVWARNSRA